MEEKNNQNTSSETSDMSKNEESSDFQPSEGKQETQQHTPTPQPTQTPEVRAPQPTQAQVVYPKNPFPWHKIIYGIETVISILLIFRVFFTLFPANESNQIVSTILTITDPLIAPFENIFPQATASGVSVEWSIFLAMVAYGLIAFILGKIVEILIYRNR